MIIETPFYHNQHPELSRQQQHLSNPFQELNQYLALDLTQYSTTFVERRLARFMLRNNLLNHKEVLQKLRQHIKYCEELSGEFLIPVTEPFRDHIFFQELTTHVLPTLKKNSNIKIWHVGCSSGEEVYSIAILLHEVGILKRCTIYASDLCEASIKTASSGVIKNPKINLYKRGYKRLFPESNIDKYMLKKHNGTYIANFIRDKIIFYQHDVLQDDFLCDLHIIFCRNLFIYFNKRSQIATLEKLEDSLVPKGILCLGMNENISYLNANSSFFQPRLTVPIFQKNLV